MQNHRPQKTSALWRYKKHFILGATVLLFAVGIFNMVKPNDPPKDTQAVAQSQPKNNDDAPLVLGTKMADTTNLKPQLEGVLKKYNSYDTGVSVIEVNSGISVQAGDNYPFVAASTTKILSAILFLNNVEAGQESLDTKIDGVTTKELLRKMIHDSDNDAWAKINEMLTKESLANYAKKQGISSYDSQKNTITSQDMALLLAKLYKGELINKPHRELLYSFMTRTSEERFIPSGITGQKVKFYHKAGYLNDRVHDVAIIDNGTSPYILVIYSKSYSNAQYDYERGQKLFQEITAITQKTFQ